MRSDIILIITGAALATYLPRAFPFLVGFPDKIPGFLSRFLSVMPVAALGALIFPAVIFSFPERPIAGIAGVAAAAAIAWLRGGLIFPVLSSIVSAYIVLSL
ncbi:AzlD domain-containing protein [Marispirochaeta sp.]|uniref:AzlD domain-containing protein n=1 Tax=Marispirochaeta sp. TaxID=2038653 RepID=UPI0029C97CBE|nr:AzlD domain-containing protein [Marispirochaeta sp.]